ncbi:hypothetical protein BJAS_P1200 [Bathymodiolus japonicus methanotrophic gill symbiont]|uniref:LolA family protein n=1 Tax=Bathymodiolus japonicus methanotrophic gill symbiont TaxID=113269 RepID=UPI001B5C01B1|nr:outer membrane lipoprotein carrier protein LolA [Bathymodiolus japonicus methanotrophic gill symbiont]GFO71585.1 hypothetical protein BJAS_P1200 [Bathymodiolus japonicus methanotrophic gill symbiont]
MTKKVCTLFLYCLSLVCLADDSIESVMQRMKPEPAVQIAYQETRTMGLFDADWQGSGFLYAALPDSMLKQQLKPEIELMAADGNQLIYHKPSTRTYHHTQLDESNPMMASLVAFKAMLTGNLAALRQLYQLKFSSSELSWKLEMTAKKHEPDEQPLKIIMQGISEQAASKMVVTLPDGDRSSYVLNQPQQGQAIRQHLQELLQSLKSH